MLQCWMLFKMMVKIWKRNLVNFSEVFCFQDSSQTKTMFKLLQKTSRVLNLNYSNLKGFRVFF